MVLQRRALSSYPKAVCNDGTTAAYYAPQEAHKTGQTVLIYLEGGGACFTADSCRERCNGGGEDSALCTTATDQEIDRTDTIWSSDPAENPGLHDSYKVVLKTGSSGNFIGGSERHACCQVYVPYCTSDVYSGRRDSEAATGGFTFHGKYVMEAVIDNVVAQLDGASAYQLVLFGVSAGAYGVAINCDAVAEKVKGVHSDADVRCVVDGTDFIPTTVALDGCDPLANNAAAATFWQGSFDQSCESELGASSPRCYVFSSYMWYIDTPFMVVAPLEEIDGFIITCAPEFPANPDFWTRWRDALVTLASQLLTVILNQQFPSKIFPGKT